MSKIAASIAITLIVATPVSAATRPCITSEEADALMTVALPGIVEGTAERCATTLPEGAFLPTGGTALAERFRREGGNAWTIAGPVVARLAGSSLEGMGEAGRRVAVDGIVSNAISEKLTDDGCLAADQLLSLLEPVPTASIGRLASLLFTLASDDESGKIPFRICTSDDR